MAVDKSENRVRHMFGQIAGRYDLLNEVLSLGVHRRWRNRVVKLVPPVDEGPILDVCTGTADLAIAYWRASHGKSPVVGADFCEPMLAIGREKCRKLDAPIELVEADAQHLPFADATFQIVCVAFGLRNVTDTNQGIAEMVRVCRPGGRVAVLEFSMPKFRPFRAAYRFYFRRILPAIGQALARNRQDAYNYLPQSVGEFLSPEALAARMESAGLGGVRHYPLTFGVAGLTVGTK